MIVERRGALRAGALWLAVLVAVTALMLLGRDRLDKAHVALAYVVIVLGASSAAGRTVGVAVVGAAFLLFNYLFLPPYYTLVISNPLDWLVLVAFLATSLVGAQLLFRANATAETATRRAKEVDRLATLGAETLSAPDATAALDAMAVVIREALACDTCDVFRIDGDRVSHAGSAVGRIDRPPVAADGLLAFLGGRAEVAVELPDGTTRLDPVMSEELRVRGLYRTLRVHAQPVGILRVTSNAGLTLSEDRARLLDALSNYAALGVERVRLVATAERAEAERQIERLRNALLMAVSHDLRTPLTTIKGLAHEIAIGASSESRAGAIEHEADRLDAMVGDLLELSRIQAGAVRPVMAVNTADELIGAALQRARGALRDHQVAVSLSDDVLAARCDFTQALRIVVNLLENAAKYTRPGSVIEISATRDAAWLWITVSDDGPGVSAGDEERIFDAFYRPPDSPPDVPGTGLGLSIARGLAEAQGGSLRYQSRPTGGASFVLALPAVDTPPDTATTATPTKATPTEATPTPIPTA